MEGGRGMYGSAREAEGMPWWLRRWRLALAAKVSSSFSVLGFNVIGPGYRATIIGPFEFKFDFSL